MNRYLIVVDMQKDFIDGALGTAEAVKILPIVAERVASFQGTVLFTRDSHGADYLHTQEGKNLPVVHCIRETDGWQLAPQLGSYAETHSSPIFDKPSFGSLELASFLQKVHQETPIDEVLLMGVCTDICVISNALLLKAALPEVPIAVAADCCAGVTPQRHQNALEAMAACQISIC